MPQFDATIKNIEGWEMTPEKAEEPAAKAIIKDLENLKKHLHAKALDGEAIRKLVIKSGRKMVVIGNKTEIKNAGKIQPFGEALGHAAERASAA